MSIKGEFYDYWANGQPYNHEYATDVDESELERLFGSPQDEKADR